MTEWLADTLFATSLLMGLVLLVRVPVTRLFGARIAYALWLIPAARLFMPALERTIIVPAAPTPAAQSLDILAAARVAAAPAEAHFDWAPLILTIWFGGALALFLWRIATYLEERQDILAEAKPVESRDDISVVEAPLVSGPLAFGFRHKYVAVPLGFYSHYSAAERDLALQHEFAHHKSGDLFVNFAGFVILCLHWFNPLAWFAWRAFRFDQELACDERVLTADNNVDRSVYGRAVAKAATGRALIFASALNNRESLKKRLKMMKRAKVSGKRRITGMASIALGLAVALPLTATVTYAYVQEESTGTEAQNEDVYERVIESEDGERRIVRRRVRAGEGDDVRIEISGGEDADGGEHEVMVVRRETGEDGEAGDRRVERRVIRHRGADGEMPSREELRAMIPDIDIDEACDDSGTPVHSVQRTGDDGRQQITIRICGEGLAEEARRSALEGLREARDELAGTEELSESLRSEILADLDREIAELQSEVN